MKGAITAMKNIDYDGYLGPRMTRDVQRKRLQHVMENELTELQRRAVIGYYLEKKKGRSPAAEILHSSDPCDHGSLQALRLQIV